jgi:hypothetical protein
MVRLRLDTWSRRSGSTSRPVSNRISRLSSRTTSPGTGGDHFFQQPFDLSGPLGAGQFQHLLAQLQVDVHDLAAELLRNGLQAAVFPGARRTCQDDEPKILVRSSFFGRHVWPEDRLRRPTSVS